jgi:hypothetical protein
MNWNSRIVYDGATRFYSWDNDIVIGAGYNSNSNSRDLSLYAATSSNTPSEYLRCDGSAGTIVLSKPLSGTTATFSGNVTVGGTLAFNSGTLSGETDLALTGADHTLYSGEGDNELKFGRNASECLRFYVQDYHSYIDYIQDADSNGDHYLHFRNQAGGTGARGFKFEGGPVGINTIPNAASYLHVNGWSIFESGGSLVSVRLKSSAGEWDIDNNNGTFGLQWAGGDKLTLSNSGNLTVGGNLTLNDSKKVILGNSSDLQIYHDGNNWIDANGVGDLYLRNLNSSGDVIVQAGASGDVYLKVNSGETALKATNNGATELYHDNSKKFETTSTGVSVNSGSVVNSANSEVDIQLPDEGGIAMGSAYTYANVYGKSGDLHLRANSYPANTGSTSKIYLSTSTSSGGQASDVIVEGGALRLANSNSLHWDNENTRILASHAAQYIRFDVGGTSNVLYATPNTLSIGAGSSHAVGGTPNLYLTGQTNMIVMSQPNVFNNSSYIRHWGTAHFQWQTYNGSNAGYVEVQPYGGQVAIGMRGTTTTHNLHIGAYGADDVNTFRIDGTNGSSETAAFVIENDGANGKVYFKHNIGNGTPATKLTLNHLGSLGIGTTAPDNPLEVVGADSGIKISSASNNRPHLRLECGTAEKLRLSANTLYGAIGDSSDTNRYMVFRDGLVGIGGLTTPAATLHIEASTPEFRLATLANAVVRFRTNGDNYINTGQNLGLGTASPSERLHIADDSDPTIRITNTDGGTNDTAAFELGVSSNTAIASTRIEARRQSDGSVDLNFRGAGTTSVAQTSAQMTLDGATGSLGIGGTPSGAYTKLHVVGTTFIDATETTGGLTVKATSNANITLQNAQNTGYNAVLAAHYNWTTPMTLSGYGATVLAMNSGIQKTLLYANNGERVRITATGVGIGLGGSDPTEVLHIKKPSGTGSFIRFEDSGGGGVYVGARSNAMELYAGGAERLKIDSSGNLILSKSTGAYVQLKDSSQVRGSINVENGSDGLVFTTGSSFTERLRINSSGNATFTGRLSASGRVGVNSTTIPTYSLNVYANTANSATGTMHVNAGLNGSGKGLVITSSTRTTSDNSVAALEVINRGGYNTLTATVEGDVTVGTTSEGDLNVYRIIQQATTGNSLYATSFSRSGSGLSVPDIWDTNGNGIVIGHNSSTAMLRVNSTGVGIGGTASHKLHVSGGSKFLGGGDWTNIERVTTTESYYSLFVTSTGTNANQAIARFSHSAAAGTAGSGSETAVIARDKSYFYSKLGVGLNDPSAKLHVYQGDCSAPTDSNTHVVIEDSDHSYLGIYGGSSSDVGIHFGDSAIDARIKYENDNRKLKFAATGTTDLMTLDSTGLGIGQTDPKADLHIGSSFSDAANDLGTAALAIKQTGASAANGIYLERSGERKGYYIGILSTANDGLTFMRNFSGTKDNVMVLTRDGNVGINKTPAGYGDTKLEVNGNVSGTRFLSGGTITNGTHAFEAYGSSFESSSIRLKEQGAGENEDPGILFQKGNAASTGDHCGGIYFQGTSDLNYAIIRGTCAGSSKGQLNIHIGGQQNTITRTSNDTPVFQLGEGGLALGGTPNDVYKLLVHGMSRFDDSMYFAGVGQITWGSMGGGTGFALRGESGRALSLGAGGSFDHIIIKTDGDVDIAQNININGATHAGETWDGAIHLKNSASIGNETSNEAVIYAEGGELKCMDDDRNRTTLSSHIDGKWVYMSNNSKTGKSVKIHMEDLVKAVEEHLGVSFSEIVEGTE